MDPQAQQLLSQLKDIQLPDPVGWWPLSQTLIGLFAGLGGILIGLTWYYLTHRRNNRYRREALALFDQAMQHADSPQARLRQANRLLKQVAVTHYGRRRVAALQGAEWVAFLHQTALYIDQPEALKPLLKSSYEAAPNLNERQVEAVIDYAKNWIKGHHK